MKMKIKMHTVNPMFLMVTLLSLLLLLGNAVQAADSKKPSEDATEESGKSAKEVKKERRAQLDAEKRQKLLNSYKPGEFERINKENLKWLQKPQPFVDTPITREHKQSYEQIKKYANLIDGFLIEKLRANNEELNPLTTDEQFVRRIYLDIAGRIPTAAETQAFLKEKISTKRSDLIDKLLLSEDYPLQMFNWVADIMRVRELKSNQGDNSSYQAWLIDQFAANRPWNEEVYDLLTAEGNLVTNPATGWLLRDRGVLLNSVSNTLTTFMGANVSCAECHDHPMANWTQRNFYELAGFFGSTEIPGNNLRAVAKVLKSSMNRVYSEKDQFLSYPDDYKYDDVKPSSRVSPVFPVLKEMAPPSNGKPVDRHTFAAWMTNTKNEQFAGAIANRLWLKLFGRAVLEPVTEMDDFALADNPKLLHGIAKLMQDLNFDIMAFQRVIFNSRAYQAKSNVTPEQGSPYRFSGPVLRRMTAEQAWDSFVTLIQGEDVNEVKRDRKTLHWSYNVFKDGFLDTLKNAKVKQEYEMVIKEGEHMASKLRSELQAERNGSAKSKKQLQAEEATITKLARASELPQPADPAHFVRQFGQSEREISDSSNREGGIPQILMLLNGDELGALVKPESHLMSLVNQGKSMEEKIDAMYVSFFSRKPSDFERSFIKKENINFKDLTWMLMNTREFMFVQ